jgi:hypothetical protein
MLPRHPLNVTSADTDITEHSVVQPAELPSGAPSLQLTVEGGYHSPQQYKSAIGPQEPQPCFLAHADAVIS